MSLLWINLCIVFTLPLLLRRSFDAFHSSLRAATAPGPALDGMHRINSGGLLPHGMHGAALQVQQDAMQANHSQARSNGEVPQQVNLPSAAQILRILDLGVRHCLEQYLPHLSPATWQQVASQSAPVVAQHPPRCSSGTIAIFEA